MNKLNIGVLGIGAIGNVISLSLNPNSNIFYFNRSPRSNLSLIRNSIHESRSIKLSTHSISEELDWLIVCLKKYHYPRAEALLKRLIGPNTRILAIRNGLDLKQDLIRFTSADKIVESIINCSVVINENGEYEIKNNPIITISNQININEISRLFTEDKISIKSSNEFRTESWKKLIESSSLGGILCLSGERFKIFKDLEILQLYKSLLDESIKVANSDGVTIDARFKNSLLEKLKTYDDNKESSMLIDRRRGNQIELMAKNGLIAQIAKKNGVDAKLNEIISLFLKHIGGSK